MAPSLYLDHNATAPMPAPVAEAMAAAFETFGNPSSVHGPGRAARHLIDEARETLAGLLGVDPAGILFTSGGTEANNLALRGTDRRRRLVSAVEHASVLDAAAADRVPVDSRGVIDLAALDAALGAEDGPALVSLMLANNETGAIQPVAEASVLARRHGALVHCDAVQALGRLPIDPVALGIDLMSLSAHKIGGPKGIGALVLVRDLALDPILRGGGQELGRRAGTENLPGIAGFAAAARLAVAALDDMPRRAALRDRLEAAASDRVPGLRIWGADAPRIANTSCLGVPGLPGETQVMGLDLAGIAVGSGAACSSGKTAPSHVLRAMGADADDAASAIRVSLGAETSAADLDRFLAAWSDLCARARTGRGAAA